MDNLFFRYDAEFFNKTALHTDKKIKERSHYFLKYSEIVSGPFGSALKSESYLQTGVPFIRIENIRGGFNINTSNMVYISEQDNNKIGNSQLNVDDIILSKVGNSIGYFARVDENIGTCNISENNIGIKTKNYSDDEKSFILTYLNCKYAKVLVLRRTSGNAQPKLNVSDLCFVPIPSFSDYFHKIVRKVVLDSQNKLFEAENIYGVAEAILQKYLDVSHCFNDDFSVKTLSNSFLQSGRLDAEYYQPKYDVLFDTLSHFSTVKLSGENGLVFIKKSIEPGSESYQNEGIPFVRVSDVNKYGIVEPTIKLSPTIVPGIESLYPRKDTILLSKDGSVGIAYNVQEDMQVVTSSALLHLTVKDTSQVLPDYLTLVLNSQVVQLQAERDCNGAILQHWKPSDIEKVLIPVLDMDKQQEISEKVQESFRLRKEAKRLLDNAIKAVEMAIETDEKTALKCLDNQQTLCTNQNL